MRYKSVVFIGAGGLAWSLGSALHAAGVHVIQVISPSVSNGEALAKLLDESSSSRLATSCLSAPALPEQLKDYVILSTSICATIWSDPRTSSSFFFP